jgi:16S rRNA U516 pseudouridylate synthase RsuA-like enzyme
VEDFATGVTLVQGMVCRPAKLKLLEGEQGRPTRIQVTVSEGKYHQVKRMVAQIGGSVAALHRVAIGPLRLDSLPEGGVREVTLEELRLLATICPSARVLLRADSEATSKDPLTAKKKMGRRRGRKGGT